MGCPALDSKLCTTTFFITIATADKSHRTWTFPTPRFRDAPREHHGRNPRAAISRPHLSPGHCRMVQPGEACALSATVRLFTLSRVVSQVARGGPAVRERGTWRGLGRCRRAGPVEKGVLGEGADPRRRHEGPARHSRAGWGIAHGGSWSVASDGKPWQACSGGRQHGRGPT